MDSHLARPDVVRDNLTAAVSLHFMHYNFARPHQSLGRNVTPAMAAGVSDHVWTCEEIAALLDRPAILPE